MQNIVFDKFIKFFGADMQVLVFDMVQIFCSSKIVLKNSSQFMVVKYNLKWRISKAKAKYLCILSHRLWLFPFKN